MPVGTVVGLIVTGWIIAHFDWPIAFYGFGVVGLLWVGLWFATVADDPATDPRLSPDERAQLVAAAPPATSPGPVPWRSLLLRGPVWAMVASHFATLWVLYFLLAWLPSYFRDVQHLSIADAGLFSAAPWLAPQASMPNGSSPYGSLIGGAPASMIWHDVFDGSSASENGYALFRSLAPVVAVPEPSTYALLMAGLLLVGRAARRRG